MTQVALLTEQQADSLRGFEVVADNYFNPIQDKHGNYIISLEEVEQCSLDWVKELELIDYEPIVHELI
jgi:uncharacterized protein (UPF0262 family)